MRRYDGNELNLGAFRSLEPYVMKRRSDSWVLALQEYDLSKTIPFIEEYNRIRDLDKKNRLTLFQVLLCAGARTVAFNPQINRFIAGKKYFQRNRLNFSFVVKPDPNDPNSPETFTKFDLSPWETLDSLREKIHGYIAVARSDTGSDSEKKFQFFAKLPHWVKNFANWIIARQENKGKTAGDFIDNDPLYCTAVFANLGSVGLKGKIVHHLFQYGTSSVFVSLSQIRKGVVITEDDKIEVRPMVDVVYNIDERVSGGKYFALVLNMLQDLTENPEKLLEKPSIPEEKIKKLNLADLTTYKPYLKAKKKLAKK